MKSYSVLWLYHRTHRFSSCLRTLVFWWLHFIWSCSTTTLTIVSDYSLSFETPCYIFRMTFNAAFCFCDTLYNLFTHPCTHPSLYLSTNLSNLYNFLQHSRVMPPCSVLSQQNFLPLVSHSVLYSAMIYLIVCYVQSLFYVQVCYDLIIFCCPRKQPHA